jgi:hypothetical protein
VHSAHRATAECACAGLRNKDGGRPWKRWIHDMCYIMLGDCLEITLGTVMLWHLIM